MDRAQALAEYLGINVEDLIDGYNDTVFETDDGEEYLVVNEDEAREEVIRDVESLIDDLGINAFTPEFQEWILDNAAGNSEWFDEALRESEESYAYDIESESGSGNYANRLVEECVEAGIISEEDLTETDDGLDYTGEKDLKEEYADYLVDQAGNPLEWFKDNFGKEEFGKAARDYANLDIEAIADEVIDQDGYANELARYDGKQIDLDGGWMAFRIN